MSSAKLDSADKLTIDIASSSDIEHFDEVSLTGSTTAYRFGMHNWLVKQSISPATIYKVSDPDRGMEIVGFAAYNMMNATQIWGHILMLCPEYRSVGVLRRISRERLFSEGIDLAALGGTMIGDWRLDVPFSGIPGLEGGVTQWKRLGMGGKIKHLPSMKYQSSAQLDASSSNNEGDKKDILSYDSLLYANVPAPKRVEFIKKWAFDPEYSICFFARTAQGSICGYGVARAYVDGEWRFNPVYADSPDIAHDILLSLAHSLPDGTSIYFCFPEFAQASIDCGTELGLAINEDSTRIRVCSHGPIELPYEKMYAKAEFWPM